jgi:hypothetical protein
MNRIKEQIREIASRYGLQIIYAFGSRAKEALDLVEGRIVHFSSTPEAEYQLYIMRLAADLLPYERMKQEMIKGALNDPQSNQS